MTRRETPLDAAEILRTLARHDVDYVVIGGLAVQTHGHTRTTQDLDIVPAPGADNAKRLSSALRSLGARPLSSAAGFHAYDSDAGGIDVHESPPGAPAYDELRREALVLDVVGIRVAVASRDHLIAMKLAAGRPIDRLDVLALTEPE